MRPFVEALNAESAVDPLTIWGFLSYGLSGSKAFSEHLVYTGPCLSLLGHFLSPLLGPYALVGGSGLGRWALV